MSVDSDFLLEFVVEGTPVSLQAKRRKSLADWKARVANAAREAMPRGYFLTGDPLAITLYYFTAAPLQGDIDNIVKPVLDALCGVIYLDDHQLHRVLVQKFEPGNVFEFKSPSALLTAAIGKAKPTLYIRLSNKPFEELV